MSGVNIINDLKDYMYMKDADDNMKLVTSVLLSGIVVGVVTFFFFSNMYSPSGLYGPASATIWGSLIILSSILLMIILKQLNDTSTASGNINMTVFSIPSIALIISLIWLISINSKHRVKINSKTAPVSFYRYSNLTMYVLLPQIIFFIFTMMYNMKSILESINNNSNSTAKHNSARLIKNMNMFNYFLMFITLAFIYIQQLILDNFSVDVL